MSPFLSYNTSGKGFPVVFLHGFCEDKSLWAAFQKGLSDDYQVISPDLPGSGDSELPANNLSMELMADKVMELLSHLKITKCTIVGHSMGGYVALAFAERYPELLSGLVLFHSTAYEDAPEKKSSRNKTVDFINKHGVEVFADSFVAPLFSPKNRQSFKETIEGVKQMVKKTSAESIIKASLAMRDRIDRREVLRNISVPVLFIAGKEDGAVPLEKTFEQASIPGDSHICILENVGHMGMYESEKKTMAGIRAFLTYLSRK